MNYRNITIDDYEALFSLWKSISGMGIRSLDDSREGIEKFLNRNPTTSFCALEDDRIIGCILCGNDGRRGFIYHTCVLPEYRKNGAGKQLVELAINALKNEGITKCALVCFSDNEIGNGFWSSIGWELRTDLNYFNLSLEKNNI